ncbi:MAG: magnesium transporter [Candidatus Omnitrophica bacterium]|nr:magnesium transporter [Candidatus Omnitrophota bacterium]
MSRFRASQTLVKTFFEKHPADAAQALEILPHEEARAILLNLSSDVASQTIEYLNPHVASLIFDDLTPEQAKSFMDNVSPKRMADILIDLPTERRSQFLQVLEASHRRTLETLLTYPPETAGGMMSPGVIALSKDLTVRDAIQNIRNLGKKKPFYYVYVTDTDNRLQGVLGMRDLILADPQTPIETLMMKEVVSVPAETDREEVVKLASKRRYLTMPVVDSEKRLLGIIHSEDLIEAAEEEASEDIQKMFGAGGDEEILSPVSFSLKKRLPWLHVNLATAFLAASVVGLFESTIARISALAVFLPVVAGQGGNTGAQTLAVVIRGLALGQLDKNVTRRVILKEAALGILNGVVVGLVTAAVAYLWHGNPYFGLVIGLAMIVNMAVATVSGAMIPIAMRAIGWDPAQSSSIILTTVTDVIGFASFLGFATFFQHLLV